MPTFMRRTLPLTICLLLACAAAHAKPSAARARTRPAKVPAPLARSRQLIVVTTPDWNSVQGTLRRYERAGGGWRQVGDSFAVVVGRSGLGWGEGVVRLPE